MTNKMLYYANDTLKKRIKEKDKNELYDVLKQFAEENNNTGAKRQKNNFPLRTSFVKTVERMTDPPKKVDSRNWKLKVTENTLLVIKLMDILNLSPKDLLLEDGKNESPKMDMLDAPSEYERGMKDGLDLFKPYNFKNERYTKKKRFDFLFEMIIRLQYEKNQLYVSLDNSTTSPYLNLKLEYYVKLKHLLKKKNLGQKLVENLKQLSESNFPGSLNLCLLYEINAYVLDLMRIIKKHYLLAESETNAETFWHNIMKERQNQIENGEDSYSDKTLNTKARKNIRNINKIETELPMIQFLIDTHIERGKNISNLFVSVVDLHKKEIDCKDLEEKTEDLLETELKIAAQIFMFADLKKNINEVKIKDFKKPIEYYKSNLIVDNQSLELNKQFLKQLQEIEGTISSLKEKPKFPDLYNVQTDAEKIIDTLWKKELTPIIAIGMGGGKTMLACKKINDMQTQNPKEYRYILVVTPVISDWKKEMKKCNMVSPVVIQGNGRKNILENGFDELKVYITSYRCLENDLEYYEKNPPFLLIYDELHQLTNSGKIQEKFLDFAERLNPKVPYKLALTGTPAQNEIEDFYMNYFFFNEQKTYIPLLRQNQWKKTVLGSDEKQTELKEKIVSSQMFFFGEVDREESNIEVRYHMLPIAMHGEHSESVAFMEGKNFNETLIRRYVLSPTSFDSNYPQINTEKESSKIEFVKAVIGGFNVSEKVIVFSYFTEPLRHLYDIFSDRAVLDIGDSSNEDSNPYVRSKASKKDISEKKKSKDEIENEVSIFNSEKGGKQILLTTIDKSGTGRNFDAIDNLILLEPWWNPMLVLQTVHRIVRGNEDNSVKKVKNIFIPIYFEKGKGNAYKFFHLERNIWASMMQKVRDYNIFLEELIGLAKEKGLPTKALESGKKHLADDVLYSLLIFDDKIMEKLERDKMYVLSYFFLAPNIKKKPLACFMDKTLFFRSRHQKSHNLNCSESIEEFEDDERTKGLEDHDLII